MKNLKILIILSLFSVNALGETITAEQQKQINRQMAGFIASFSQYCQGGKKIISKRSSVMKYFASIDARHVKDYEENVYEDYDSQTIDVYLDNIEDQFQSGFDMHIKKNGLLNCSATINDEPTAIYYLEKSVKCNGDFFVCSEYLLINLPKSGEERDSLTYKIREVLSAADFKSRNLGCAEVITAKATDERKFTLENYATKLYTEGDYKGALEKFVQLASRSAGNRYAGEMIDSCRRHLPADFLLQQAEKLFTMKEYITARVWYDLHFSYHTDTIQKALIYTKLNDAIKIQADTSYNIAIKNADEAFHAGDMGEACRNYSQAIVLKPGMTYPKLQLALAQKKDDDVAAKKIDSIERLYVAKKVTAGDYFRVLNEYDDDKGRLSIKQDIAIVLFLYKNDRSVRQVIESSGLDKSNKGVDNFWQIYARKLNDAYLREPDPKNREDALFVLKTFAPAN